MSKFCKNCGSLLNDDDLFCSNCSTKQDTDENQNNDAVQQNPTENVQADGIQGKIQNVADNAMKFTGEYVEKAKKDPKFAIIGIGAVVAVIVVIAILVSLLSGAPYKSAVDNYFDVAFHGKFEKIEKMAPEAYWDYMDDEYDTSIDDILEQYEDSDYYDDMIDSLEDEYGKNLKFSYKITDEDELSEKELDEIRDGLKENYDIAKKDVKKAYELEVEVSIKGKDDEDTNDLDIIVANIDGKWYIVSEYGTFDFGL